MERIGYVVSGIGRKLGKAGAIGTIALGAVNVANVTGGHDGNGHLGRDGNGTKACESQARELWKSPEFQEPETKYLQQELNLQQKQVDTGKRPYVDEQRSYEKAQHRVMHDMACSSR